MIEAAARRSASDGPRGGWFCADPKAPAPFVLGISDRGVAWGMHGSRGHCFWPRLSLSGSTRSPALRCWRKPFR
eukprot:8389483-Heterocapsa_arctica.AAC.1